MYRAELHYMTISKTHRKESHTLSIVRSSLRGLRDAIEHAINADDQARAALNAGLNGMTGAEIAIYADGTRRAFWRVCRFSHVALKGLQCLREASERLYVSCGNVFSRLAELKAKLAELASKRGSEGKEITGGQEQAEICPRTNENKSPIGKPDHAEKATHNKKQFNGKAISLHWTGNRSPSHRTPAPCYSLCRAFAQIRGVLMGNLPNTGRTRRFNYGCPNRGNLGCSASV